VQTQVKLDKVTEFTDSMGVFQAEVRVRVRVRARVRARARVRVFQAEASS
jgi:hypothetical protein